MDCNGDRLSSGDREVGEIDSEVGEPLEPCLVSDTAVAGDGEVNTRLKDRVLSGVSVDSDPCRLQAPVPLGVGTTKEPVTVVNVCPEGGLTRTAPDQLVLNSVG